MKLDYDIPKTARNTLVGIERMDKTLPERAMQIQDMIEREEQPSGGPVAALPSTQARRAARLVP